MNDTTTGRDGAFERHEIDRHIAGCADCREAWQVHELLAASPVPRTPPSLRFEVGMALRAVPVAAGRRFPLRRHALAGSLLLVGVAAIGAVGLQVLDLGGGTADAQGELPTAPAESTGSPVAPAAMVTAELEDHALESDLASVAAADPVVEPAFALDPAMVVVLPVVDEAESDGARRLADDLRGQLIARLEQSTLQLFDPGLARGYVEAGMSDLMIGRTIGAGSVLLVRTRMQYGAPHVVLELVDPATDGLVSWGSWAYLENAATLPDNAQFALEGVVFGLSRKANPEPPRQMNDALAEMEALLLDASATELMRVEALVVLSHSSGTGGVSFSDPVLAAAVSLATMSDDPEIRGYVWRAVGHLNHPYLRQPLIDALKDDASADVRRAAAAGLAAHVAASQARQALEAAGMFDESEAVRAAAAAALRSNDDRLAAARASFFDTSLAASGRLNALNAFYDAEDRLSVDGEVTVALLAIAEDPAQRYARETALSMIAVLRSPDAALAEPLLTLFTEDVEINVRAGAALALQHFVDRHDVFAALEQASVSDPERAIRNAARQALLGLPSAR